MNRAFLHACCIAMLTVSCGFLSAGDASFAARTLAAGAILLGHLVLLQATLGHMLSSDAGSAAHILRVPGLLAAGIAPAWLVGAAPLAAAVTCIFIGGVLYAVGDAMRRTDAAMVAGARERGC